MSPKRLPPVKERLRRAGIRHFDELIHDQPREWLLHYFHAGARKYPVNVARLMRNLIWQLRERIQSGDKPPYHELVRTFWYMYAKPTLARADALADDTDQYKQLVDHLVYLVKDIQVMRYADIGFADDNPADRMLGAYPNIILVAEKQGHVGFLREMTEKHRISGIALRGQPSLISVEYFVDQIRARKVDLRRTFHLLTIMDYDPSGLIIRDAFVDDLACFGIRNVKIVDIISPDMLTPDEILNSRYPIRTPPNMRRKNKAWHREVTQRKYANQKHLEKGKKLYGLEAQAVSTMRIATRIEELVKPIYGLSERQLKAYELNELVRSLMELMAYKLK